MPVIAPSGNGTHPSTATNKRNNGGTLINAGNVETGGVITKVLGVNTIADDFGTSFGSKVVTKIGTGANTTDRFGISGIIPTVGVAYRASATEWVMKGVTTTLAGTVNSVLLNKGSDYNGAPEDSVHQLTRTRAYGSGVTTEFDMLAKPDGTINPNFTKGGNAGGLVQFVRASGAGNITATDDAATPTRAVPGELTYRFGGALPRNDVYKAKDSFES